MASFSEPPPETIADQDEQDATRNQIGGLTQHRLRDTQADETTMSPTTRTDTITDTNTIDLGYHYMV